MGRVKIVRHRGRVESARTWDETVCEVDSWQFRILYIISRTGWHRTMQLFSKTRWTGQGDTEPPAAVLTRLGEPDWVTQNGSTRLGEPDRVTTEPPRFYKARGTGQGDTEPPRFYKARGTGQGDTKPLRFYQGIGEPDRVTFRTTTVLLRLGNRTGSTTEPPGFSKTRGTGQGYTEIPGQTLDLIRVLIGHQCTAWSRGLRIRSTWDQHVS